MKTNNATYLKDENILSLLSLNNLIVPEIQREYVWGKKENASVLNRFIKNIKDNCYACESCNHVHKKKDINIGFLYSYKPSYVSLDGERFLDEFLIDGQQRFTTLFLLLSFLAVKEEKVKDFLALIRFDKELGKMNFDYKVRNITHRFLIDFLAAFKEDIKIEDILPYEENGKWIIFQTWFLSDYKSDVTIQAMLGALNKISDAFNDNFCYFDYVLTAVRFWHFKTEATSQGEELYITMNSRGERLSENEEHKSMILPTGELPIWGKKWEEWQDFFWKNRGENTNADRGFNEFLNCITGLLEYKKKTGIISDDTMSISAGIIEEYFNAMGRIYSLGEHDFSWVKKLVDNIKERINKQQTNWLVNYNDDNRAAERRRMVLMWFVLELLKSESKGLPVTNKELRALRFIWLRYNNNERSVISIKQFLIAWQTNSFGLIEWHGDEKEKYEYLNINSIIEKDFTDEEKIIWKIEDHPLNINGRDLGSINISHIVDFSTSPNLQELNMIYGNYIAIFPCEEKGCSPAYEKKIKSLMLHYNDENGDPFWQRVTPWYYSNYDCSDWRRIVRSGIFKTVFREVFDNNNDCIIDQLLGQKKVTFYAQYKDKPIAEIRNSNLSEQHQLVFYSDLIDVWECGNIAFYGNLPENETRIFNNEIRIYKAGRYFNGNREFWNEVKSKDINVELQRILDHYKI